MAYNQYGRRVYDAATVLKENSLVAASADYAILDIGAGLVEADVVIDVKAMEFATDEKYIISIEGSNTADMSANSVALARLNLGDAVAPMDVDAVALGRYILPVRNEQNGVVYRYIRLSLAASGTIATGIEFSAFLAKDVNI